MATRSSRGSPFERRFSLAAGMRQKRILIFVEDPGAANFIVTLPESLRRHGMRPLLFADGTAVSYLQRFGLKAEVRKCDVTAVEMLKAHQVDGVVCGTGENPRTYAFDLITAARELGIPSIGLVDGSGNHEFRFRGNGSNPLTYLPDYIATPDEEAANQYFLLGASRSRVEVTGHPYLDHVREEGSSLAGRDRDVLRARIWPDAARGRKAIVFLAELSTGIRHSDYQKSPDYLLHGTSGATGRTEIVLDEFFLAVASLSARPYLVLRLHPKCGPRDFAGHQPNFDFVSREGRVLEHLVAADLVVGLTSMSLQECAILGKPGLAIIPRVLEKDWLPTIGAGLTECACTRQELLRLLPLLLADPPDLSGGLSGHFLPDATRRLASLVQRATTGFPNPTK